MTSLDGRITGFPADLGVYYQVAAELPQQAVLTSSTTLLKGALDAGIDLTSSPDTEADSEEHADADTDRGPEPSAGAGASDLPWLVVVDGRGRLRRTGWLRRQPYWRDVIVLCCQTTPGEHLARLRQRRIEHVLVGAERVDLAGALVHLAERYQIRQLRTDAGGTLNGLLLAQWLVDEVSLIVAPYLVGTGQLHPVHLADGLTHPDPVRWALNSVDRLASGHVWLRYTVWRD